MSIDVEFLTKEEEYRLGKLAQAGDVEARNRIVMGIYPLIFREAAKLARRYGKDADDLVNVGIVRVLEVFPLFDPDKGYRATTYFMVGAWRTMRRFALCKDQVIDLPANFERGIPEKFLGDADKANRVGSLHAVINGHSKKATELGSLIEDKSAGAVLEGGHDVAVLQRAMATLNERHREILEGRMQGKALWQIGEKLGITKERVRQLETKAIDKLIGAMSKIRYQPAKPAQRVGRRTATPVRHVVEPRQCPVCKCTFTPKRSRIRCCSKRCKTLEQWGGTPETQTLFSPRGVCKNCGRNVGLAPRGICWPCYRNTEVRLKFPKRKTGTARRLPWTICPICSKEFRSNGNKYCSRVCVFMAGMTPEELNEIARRVMVMKAESA